MRQTIIPRVVVLLPITELAAQTSPGSPGAGGGQAVPPEMRITEVFPHVITAGNTYKDQPYEVTIVGENLPTKDDGFFVAQAGQGLRRVLDVRNKETAADQEKAKSTWKPVLADFDQPGKKLTLYWPMDGIVHGPTKLTLVKTIPTSQQAQTPNVTLAYWNLPRFFILG